MTANRDHPLFRGAWVILLAALAGGLAAIVWVNQQDPRYEAVGRVFVQPNDLLETSSDVVSGLYPLDQSRLIPTYADIASSDSVQVEASRRLGAESVADYRVSARMLPESFALEVAVIGPDPEVAESYATYVIEVAGRRFTDAFRVYSVTNLSPAQATRISLSTPSAAGLGVIAGATAGALLLLLLTPLRRSSSVPPAPSPRRREDRRDFLVGMR